MSELEESAVNHLSFTADVSTTLNMTDMVVMGTGQLTTSHRPDCRI